jgi:hypothetical protein
MLKQIVHTRVMALCVMTITNGNLLEYDAIQSDRNLQPFRKCELPQSSDSLFLYLVGMSRDSAVDIATAYGLDDQGVGVRVPVGQEFSLRHVV